MIKQFSNECWKELGIISVLLYFALWLVQKTRATLQSGAKQKPTTT